MRTPHIRISSAVSFHWAAPHRNAVYTQLNISAKSLCSLLKILTHFVLGSFFRWQVYYYIVDSPRNEGKEFFEINLQSGEIFTKVVFDREKQGAYALEVEARDGAPSARPNSNGQPNSGKKPQNVYIWF